jgi:hypothetical protein
LSKARKNDFQNSAPAARLLRYFCPSYLMQDLSLLRSFIVEDLTLQIVAFRSGLLAVVSREAVR